MNKLPSHERGQALVELALVLPILLLILMAIVDFGRIFHGYLSVTTAAREGARSAAMGQTDTQIRTNSIQSATPLDSALLTVQIIPAAGERFSGTNVEVTVTYRLAILTPIMQSFFPNPLLVTGRAVMRHE